MQKKLEPEFLKILLLGDSRSGKTTLLQKYVGDSDPDCYYETPGIDQRKKSLFLEQQKIKLRIWDATGSPQLSHLLPPYLAETHGVLLCFDLTRRNSFAQIELFIDLLRAHNQTASIILVGCKADRGAPYRQISKQQALEKAESLALSYVETSAKEQIDVEKPFKELTKKIVFAQGLQTLIFSLQYHFKNYLKAYDFKNTQGFFKIPSVQEKQLSDEYAILLQCLPCLSNAKQLQTFFQKTLDLHERAEKLFHEENPVLGMAISGSLEKMLDNSLSYLSKLPKYMLDLNNLNEKEKAQIQYRALLS
jgi:Ras-related protein Rab-1A